MSKTKKWETVYSIIAVTAVVLGLYFSSLYSYILFHSLIEIITIAVAFALFVLTWNTRKYLKNNYLRLLGIVYAFIALIDLGKGNTFTIRLPIGNKNKSDGAG